MNALTHDMAIAIHQALRDWRDDDGVDLVIIDAAGEGFFCAGGDVAALYHAGKRGDHHVSQAFFRDEYPMNAEIADYPKPVVAFMHGYTMGGGIGLGGHASHRIVGNTTRMAMPESIIGLIPDVGGTWLLGRAPGRIGEYLALTGERMRAGGAIHAGFADVFLPERKWPALIAKLEETGDVGVIQGQTPPPSTLAERDLSAFGGRDVDEIIANLRQQGDDATAAKIAHNSPLSLAAGLQMVRAARGDDRLQTALSREFRFTFRASEQSDFIEGVRAQLIDKDRSPNWTVDGSDASVQAMLAPLGDNELTWRE